MTRILVLALGIVSSAVAYVPPASAYDPCERAIDQYNTAYREWAQWCGSFGSSCPYPGGPRGQRLNQALSAAEAAVRRECH